MERPLFLTRNFSQSLICCPRQPDSLYLHTLPWFLFCFFYLSQFGPRKVTIPLLLLDFAEPSPRESIGSGSRFLTLSIPFFSFAFVGYRCLFLFFSFERALYCISLGLPLVVRINPPYGNTPGLPMQGKGLLFEALARVFFRLSLVLVPPPFCCSPLQNFFRFTHTFLNMGTRFWTFTP